jgi:hypothetical protein
MENPSWVSKGDTDINKQLKEKSCIDSLALKNDHTWHKT